MASKPSPERFGIALFGIGRMGMVHFGNLLRNTRAVVRYVIDEATDLASKRVKDYGMEHSITVLHPKEQDQALKDDSVHGVFICTPTFTHEAIVKNALKHNKGIFCEKPISKSMEETIALYEEADRVNKPLLCAFNRRFDPSLADLRKRAMTDEIGKIHIVKTCSRDYPRNTLAYLQTSGGIFHDCAIHDIDIVCWIMRDFPISVYTQGHAHDADIGAIPDVDTVVIVMKFASGAIATIDCSREAVYGHDQRVEVFGSNGMLVSNNQQPTSVASFTRSGVTEPCLKPSCMDRYMDSYKLLAEHFIDVLGGKELLYPKQQILNVLTIAEACGDSYKSGEAVKLSYD